MFCLNQTMAVSGSLQLGFNGFVLFQAQHALQKADKALQTLSAAVANDPKNPLCKFHRASIFFAAGRYAEALKELEELKEIVPKESLVYYLTGKVKIKIWYLFA